MILDDKPTSILVPEVDAEHAALQERLRALMAAASGDGVGIDALRAQAAGLLDEVGAHFAHESRLMRGIGYPSTARHEAAHAGFVKGWRGVLETLRDADDLVHWLSKAARWFHDHHYEEDLLLGIALQRGG